MCVGLCVFVQVREWCEAEKHFPKMSQLGYMSFWFRDKSVLFARPVSAFHRNFIAPLHSIASAHISEEPNQKKRHSSRSDSSYMYVCCFVNLILVFLYCLMWDIYLVKCTLLSFFCWISVNVCCVGSSVLATFKSSI